MEVEKPTRYVPWCSVDPFPSLEKLDDEISKFPLYFNAPPPFQCTVKAGEILYLYDSLPFHSIIYLSFNLSSAAYHLFLFQVFTWKEMHPPPPVFILFSTKF